jgi:glucosamine-6-phosphate deaminase
MKPQHAFLVDKTNVKIYKNRQDMGIVAAKETATAIISLLNERKNINMMFAAAPSQNEFLENIVKEKNIPWNRINGFHMDEYIGLSETDEQSFVFFLKNKLFNKVNFRNFFALNGNADNAEDESRRYSKLLEQHPIDIVCMGIGENGHIAFNDPHVASFNDNKLVKVVELDEKCREQQVHDGCFTSIDKVPKKAITVTIPGLVKPEQIFCIVPGYTKAEAIYNMIKGPISEKCPASILRKHKNATLYADIESASKILE